MLWVNRANGRRELATLHNIGKWVDTMAKLSRWDKKSNRQDFFPHLLLARLEYKSRNRHHDKENTTLSN